MSDVFISYSRKNSEFARRLSDKLILHGKDAWVDWEGIPLTSPNWWSEIKTGIEAADSFVFIMSPDSMASVVCNMELDYAIELRKRIIPVVYQDVVSGEAFASIADFEPDNAMEERLAGKDPLVKARGNWQRLSHINWVFFRETDDFDEASDILFRIVATDLAYVKEHTRYQTRALEWLRENKRGDLLLFGEEIGRAEAWFEKAETYAAVEESGKVDLRVSGTLTRHILRFDILLPASTESDLRNPDKAQLRADILAMRADGMSYRQIAKAVGLHWTRVQQIVNATTRLS